MLKKGVDIFRHMAAALLSCSDLYVVAFLLIAGIFAMDWPIWYKEPVEQIRAYMIVPWGAGLGMLAIVRRSEEKKKLRMDFLILTALLLWIIVPFGLRFGFTFNNVNSWHNAFVAFFGIYMMTAVQDRKTRERGLSVACACVLLISLVWGGLLLLCSAMATSIDLGAGGYGFGVQFTEHGCLCSGMHYNITAMIAVFCCLVNISGFSRSKYKLIKALYAVGSAMMALVTVLTQSRTGRYALLIALALGAFSWCFTMLKERKYLVRLNSVLMAGLSA